MNNNSKVLLALLGGVAAVMAIGILLAPDKGEETRKKVSNAARKFTDKVKEGIKTVNDLKNEFTEPDEEPVA